MNRQDILCYIKLHITISYCIKISLWKYEQDFKLNFADRWIILWWRRWKLAPSISISHNHYPVFPWYFIGISPCIFPCISPCIVLVLSLFDCHDLVPLLMRIEIVGKLLIWITSQSHLLPLFTKIENVL